MRKFEKTDEGIFRIDEDGKTWAIPEDEANSDYKAYLESLNESNEL